LQALSGRRYGRCIRSLALLTSVALIGVILAGCAVGQTGRVLYATGSGARVTGQVQSDQAGPVQYWARYGPTASLGSESSHATTNVGANSTTPVEVDFDGLARSTLYHYRVCARGAGQNGAVCGVDRTLTTQSFDCGDTLTASVRLTESFACGQPPVPPLTVGAAGIDINLAQHGLGVALVNDGFSDVTIRNGSTLDIRLSGASRNSIQDVAAAGIIGFAISISGGSQNQIRASSASGRAVAITSTGSSDLVVADSEAAGELGPGIAVHGDRARIVRNRVTTTRETPQSPGIELAGADNRALDNRVTGTATGVALLSGAGNVLGENALTGIVDRGFGPPEFGDGIYVAPAATGTLVRDNTASDNDDDGIEVAGPSARLRGNQTFGNGDFGIDAVAGVTDLGGNVAGGNGNPLQCRNVFCS
jgi:parallel beta-helix repeat protein